VVNVGGAKNDIGGLVDMNKIKQWVNDIVICQRNWDENFQLPQEHLDYIIESCTTVPTKQQKEIYSLVAVTNREIIEKLFEASYDATDRRLTKYKNSQVRANLVLLWVPGPIQKKQFSFGVAVGMSANAAALAGAELNYKTGFCKCMQFLEVRDIINKKFDKLIDKSKGPELLMLGIGKPNDNFDPRDVVIKGTKTTTKPSHGTKDIKVYWLT